MCPNQASSNEIVRNSTYCYWSRACNIEAIINVIIEAHEIAVQECETSILNDFIILALSFSLLERFAVVVANKINFY